MAARWGDPGAVIKLKTVITREVATGFDLRPPSSPFVVFFFCSGAPFFYGGTPGEKNNNNKTKPGRKRHEKLISKRFLRVHLA